MPEFKKRAAFLGWSAVLDDQEHLSLYMWCRRTLGQAGFYLTGPTGRTAIDLWVFLEGETPAPGGHGTQDGKPYLYLPIKDFPADKEARHTFLMMHVRMALAGVGA